MLDAEGDGSLVGRYFIIAKSRGFDIKALLAAIDELTAQRDAVLALHKEDGIHGPGVYCHHDLQRWPCETVRTLTNAWEKGTS